MDALDFSRDDFLSDLVKTVGSSQVNAAMSRLISANIGDMVVVFSRSPAHKHLGLADVERTVLPSESLHHRVSDVAVAAV